MKKKKELLRLDELTADFAPNYQVEHLRQFERWCSTCKELFKSNFQRPVGWYIDEWYVQDYGLLCTVSRGSVGLGDHEPEGVLRLSHTFAFTLDEPPSETIENVHRMLDRLDERLAAIGKFEYCEQLRKELEHLRGEKDENG